MKLISKEQFLEEHNKLSPASMQATLALLDRFKEEKRPQLKDDTWCLDKLRIPFMSWLATAQSQKANAKNKNFKKSTKKEIYRNYPETHYES